jgi:hypothetical protein
MGNVVMVALAVGVAVGLLAAPLPAWAGSSNQAISVQGVLRQGGALQSMPVDLDVSLYSSATATTPLYTQHFAQAAVDNGFFSIELGDLGGALGGQPEAWVGVRVGGDSVELPRQHVTASPYALSAASADSLSSVCVGCITSAMLAADVTVAQCTNADQLGGQPAASYQRAITPAACPAGQAITGVAADGTATCAAPGGWVTIYDDAYAANGVQTINVAPSHGTITLRIVFSGTVASYTGPSEIFVRTSAGGNGTGATPYRSYVIGDNLTTTNYATGPVQPSLMMARTSNTSGTGTTSMVAFDYLMTETPGSGAVGFGQGSTSDGTTNILMRAQGNAAYSATSTSISIAFWNTSNVTGRFVVLQLM